MSYKMARYAVLRESNSPTQHWHDAFGTPNVPGVDYHFRNVKTGEMAHVLIDRTTLKWVKIYKPDDERSRTNLV